MGNLSPELRADLHAVTVLREVERCVLPLFFVRAFPIVVGSTRPVPEDKGESTVDVAGQPLGNSRRRGDITHTTRSAVARR